MFNFHMVHDQFIYASVFEEKEKKIHGEGFDQN